MTACAACPCPCCTKLVRGTPACTCQQSRQVMPNMARHSYSHKPCLAKALSQPHATNILGSSGSREAHSEQQLVKVDPTECRNAVHLQENNLACKRWLNAYEGVRKQSIHAQHAFAVTEACSSLRAYHQGAVPPEAQANAELPRQASRSSTDRTLMWGILQLML